MGAIAVSKEEEQQIEELRKELRISTKSGVIRVALRTLAQKVDEERLRGEIEESVRRCASADKQENRQLFPAGVARPGESGSIGWPLERGAYCSRSN